MNRPFLLAAALTLTAVSAGAGALVRVEEPIAGRYIVVLKEGVARSGKAPAAAGPSVASVADDLARGQGAVVERVFEHALRGFAVRMSAAAAALLAADRRVEYVEQDRLMGIDTTQTGATWGIDRIDQRNLPL